MNTTDSNLKRAVTLDCLATHCVASCQKLLAGITQVRNALLTRVKETLQVNDQMVRLALNEAEALAWETDYPHLFFPTLAEEKVLAVAAWNERQRRLRSGHPNFRLAA